MNILGIYGAFDWDGNTSFDQYNRVSWVHDSGATLIKNDEHICSISEERLSRIKYDGNFPTKSIQYCLNVGGLNYEDIDIVVVPSMAIPFFYDNLDFGIVDSKISNIFPNATIQIISHHQAHAISSVVSAPFNEGTVITLDGTGSILRAYNDSTIDVENNTLGYFNGFSLRSFVGNSRVNNFGDLYSRKAFECYVEKTNFQGKWHDEKVRQGIEGKIMGLSAYGNAHRSLNYIVTNEFSGPPCIVFDEQDNVEGDADDKANALQLTLEESIVDWLKELHDNGYITDRICFAGGVFLNVLANSVIKRLPFIKQIHIPPFTSDVGLHFGAAASVLYKQNRSIKMPVNHSLLGKEYCDKEIEQQLKAFGIPFQQFDEDYICSIVSEEINDDKIVAWFQGRSEFGPRALGSRSILMSATKKENKDILNDRVKHREYWRPFAGIILEENLDDYFEDSFSSPYMLYSMIVRENKRSVIPAITHEDFSCRIQSVNEQYNARLTKLLHKYKQLSGIPVILNTSFNDNGEPIVETPADAIRAFLNMDIDTLAIGNYIVKKENI